MPPTTQPDPRSPRPFTAPIGSLDITSSSDSSLNNTTTNPNISSRFGELSRRLREDRARRNAARDAEASFRQRLRSLHASQSSSNLPSPPISMLDSRQRLRDLVMEQRDRVMEQLADNRTRLRRAETDLEQLEEHNPTRSAYTERPERLSSRTTVSPRRRRRPSYSLLRPANAEAERDALTMMQRQTSNRRRRAHIIADRQNSPFALGRGDRMYLSDTITDSDTDLHEPRDRRPQTKRRKLSHNEGLFDGYDPVRYGWNGQVDPGHLRLEIVSCDGGQYDQQLKYRAENVLRNDKSVYCSNSSTCNFLFRHQAETSFNLDALVIKGPESGYTSPVQQGLVFVGTSMDDLIRSAAAYQMTYYESETSDRPMNEREISDLIEDHSVYLNSQTRDLSRFWENISRSEQYQSFLGEGLDCDWPILNGIFTGNQLTTAPSPPYSDQAQALPEFSDMESPSNESDPRGPLRTTVYTYGNHTVIASGNGNPTQLPPVHDDTDTGYGNYWDGYECPEHYQRMTPGRIQKVVSPSRKDSEITTPTATFFIRRSQNRITIKFDPPL
jgi:hypothetical protein